MQKRISFSQADQILAKSGQMPFLKMLKEETENELHLVIFGAVVEENTDFGDSYGNPVLDTILAQCKPIVSDSSKRFDIVFEEYIIYQVRNESYSSFDELEERSGTYLLQFQKSHFLDFLLIATDAQQLKDGSFYPAPWKHYEIRTQNHIIDVVAQKGPKVLYSENT